MNCLNCGTRLIVAERQGIEIDYCPSCRGVWLDRGELDKIIDRATRNDLMGPESGGRNDERDEARGRSRSKRGGLLGELFDF